jgi:hypothetical protein
VGRPARKTLSKLPPQTVKPVFGIIKAVLRFQRFLMSGSPARPSAWLQNRVIPCTTAKRTP